MNRLPLEQKIQNRFKILSRVHKSSHNVIYKAIDEKSGEVVALKIPAVKNFNSSTLIRQEFRKVSSLYNKNIINMYNLYMMDNITFYTMEYLKGYNLQRKIKYKSIDKNYDQIRNILLQVTEGIRFLHLNEIIHNDIKPENIIIDGERAIIIDFELSLLKREKRKNLSGTFAYMAPEILKGGQPGAASDLYSMGVVLYELLTGRFPEELIFGLTPVEPKKIISKTPTYLSSLTLSLLSPNPLKRPPSEDIIKRLDGDKDHRIHSFKNPMVHLPVTMKNFFFTESAETISAKSLFLLLKVRQELVKLTLQTLFQIMKKKKKTHPIFVQISHIRNLQILILCMIL